MNVYSCGKRRVHVQKFYFLHLHLGNENTLVVDGIYITPIKKKEEETDLWFAPLHEKYIRKYKKIYTKIYKYVHIYKYIQIYIYISSIKI